MARERSLLSLIVIAALGLGLYACSSRSKGDPLGSSANHGGGTAVSSTTVVSAGVYAPWNGITPVEHIQTTESIAAGPVNPLTGASSLQISALTASGSGYKTNGSYRLATCRPNPGVCPSLNKDWQTPHDGSSLTLDLQIDIPLNDVGSVIISFGNPGCTQTYRIPDATVATAIGHFVRVAVPLSAFTPSSGCAPNQDATIFQLDVFRVGIGTPAAAIMSVDRIIWTN